MASGRLGAGLENIDTSAFPITVFVRRDGTIEGFHSSFPADKWGPLYEHTVAAHDRPAAAIVAKPAK